MTDLVSKHSNFPSRTMIILAICLAVVLSACGDKPAPSTSTGKNSTATQKTSQDLSKLSEKELIKRLHQKLDALEKQKQALRQRLNKIRSEIKVLQKELKVKPKNPSPKAETKPAPRHQNSFIEKQAHMNRLRDALDKPPPSHYRFIDRKFKRERRSRRWAASAEMKLRKSLRHKSFQDSKVVSVRCKKTLCRAIAYHQKFETIVTIPKQVVFNEPWSNPDIAILPRKRNGGFKSIIYISRQGYKLNQ